MAKHTGGVLVALFLTVLALSGCEFGLAPAWQAPDKTASLSVQFSQLSPSGTGDRAIVQGNGTLYIRTFGGPTTTTGPLYGPYTVASGTQFTTTEIPAGTYSSMALLYVGSKPSDSAKFTFQSKEYTFTELMKVSDDAFKRFLHDASAIEDRAAFAETFAGSASWGESSSVTITEGATTKLAITLIPIIGPGNVISWEANACSISPKSSAKAFYGLESFAFPSTYGSVTLTLTPSSGSIAQAAFYTTDGALISAASAASGAGTAYTIKRSDVAAKMNGDNLELDLYLDCAVSVTIEKALVLGEEAIASEASRKLVAEGITALESMDYDLAFTKFTAAYASDANNTDALFWCALLNVASISTDPATVSLMRDRIGVLDYPATMNALFSNTWFNATWYGTKTGFKPATAEDIADGRYQYIRGYIVPDTDYANGYDYCYVYLEDAENGGMSMYDTTFVPSESGSYYASGYSVGYAYYSSYNGNLPSGATRYVMDSLIDLTDAMVLPRVELPSWAQSAIGLTAYGEDASHLTINTLGIALACNIIARNPAGLNAMVDSVLAGSYGSRLTKVVELIDNLPDTATITVPTSLIAAYSGGSAPTQPIVIHKGELKAYSGWVQIERSFAELLASYNLNYPIAFLQNALWTTDGAGTALEALFAQQNPLEYGFLSNRSDASRSAAKASMLAGLADISEGISLISGNLDDSSTIAAQAVTYMGTLTIADAKAKLAESKSLIETFSSALTSGETLYVNPDGTTVATLLSMVGGTQSFGFIPATLYATDIFNPAKFLEINGTESAPTGIKLYGFTGTPPSVTYAELIKPADILSANSYYSVAFKAKKSRVSQLLTMPDGYMSADSNGYYTVPMYAEAEASLFDEDSWNLIEWLR